MTNHISRAIMMVRPTNFNYNHQTASSNAFQKIHNISSDEINKRALDEFDNLVKKLTSLSVNVIVFDDKTESPDAIFPNNWITFHENGYVLIYPMCAENRRLEKRKDIIEKLKLDYKFNISKLIDLSFYENEGIYLEGTGSMVFDHDNKLIYSCISSRTDPNLLQEISMLLDYKAIKFKASISGLDIYHTNVMMSIGDKYAVVCLDSIENEIDRRKVIKSLTSTGHEIIDISLEQMKEFACNVLQISDKEGDKLTIISERALKSLNKDQINKLEKYSTIVSSNIDTIENCGGGGIRCMIAEIFLP